MTANPLDVACPICNAKAGEHCLPKAPGYQHAPRLFAAENAPKPRILSVLRWAEQRRSDADGAADTLLDLFAKANAVIDRAAESPKVKLDSPLWLAVAELRAALTAAQGT